MSKLAVRKASRKKLKIKMALAGPSGSGKTATSLLLAFGLTGDWSKVGVIDTENRSAELYVGQKFEGQPPIGEFLTLWLDPPFSPERYIEAIDALISEGVEVVVIDSLSHEWMGEGGILDIKDTINEKNDFAKWKHLTPRHNALIDKIRLAPVHVITTMRSKQEYIQTEESGKKKIEKMGMGTVQRDGMDYEFTTMLEMNMNHKAVASKDRTGLFSTLEGFTPGVTTGRKILEWTDSGSQSELDEYLDSIKESETVAHVQDIYKGAPKHIRDSKEFVDSIKRRTDTIVSSNPEELEKAFASLLKRLPEPLRAQVEVLDKLTAYQAWTSAGAKVEVFTKLLSL